MTDELDSYGAGSYITEFVSGGPKNYAYTVYSPTKNEYNQVCKVKGFMLNYQASQLVNFDSMKRMILNTEEPSIPILSKNIRRTATHEVVTKKDIKQYQPNSTKRKFLSNHDSVPYGFKSQKLTHDTSSNTSEFLLKPLKPVQTRSSLSRHVLQNNSGADNFWG
ncbi:hypothetical protein JTB14_036743 [Gonioctena quinquepunctata]|nr:hypothetical protein JTB14_036743 [Gonioctena quinquepunctata]